MKWGAIEKQISERWSQLNTRLLMFYYKHQTKINYTAKLKGIRSSEVELNFDQLLELSVILTSCWPRTGPIDVTVLRELYKVFYEDHLHKNSALATIAHVLRSRFAIVDLLHHMDIHYPSFSSEMRNRKDLLSMSYEYSTTLLNIFQSAALRGLHVTQDLFESLVLPKPPSREHKGETKSEPKSHYAQFDHLYQISYIFREAPIEALELINRYPRHAHAIGRLFMLHQDFPDFGILSAEKISRVKQEPALAERAMTIFDLMESSNITRREENSHLVWEYINQVDFSTRLQKNLVEAGAQIAQSGRFRGQEAFNRTIGQYKQAQMEVVADVMGFSHSLFRPGAAEEKPAATVILPIVRAFL